MIGNRRGRERGEGGERKNRRAREAVEECSISWCYGFTNCCWLTGWQSLFTLGYWALERGIARNQTTSIISGYESHGGICQSPICGPWWLPGTLKRPEITWSTVGYSNQLQSWPYYYSLSALFFVYLMDIYASQMFVVSYIKSLIYQAHRVGNWSRLAWPGVRESGKAMYMPAPLERTSYRL